MNKHLEHLRKEYKTTANSFTQSAANLFGYFPANLVYGYVDYYYSSRVAQFCNIIPVILVSLAMYYLYYIRIIKEGGMEDLERLEKELGGGGQRQGDGDGAGERETGTQFQNKG
eukprot:CAMPEP_0116951936 /NCGR_PEP_ID=MMETSP0467-20121206/40424_1 /TAXON_ID=283647 /ORGANISM="Mesodinium pulex, Strain SPMC105" /LENGTH=113 /DNA_ID=CAMNT_0004637093 /DNA_START=1425 /DNA_END=1766 /DNA_ORIENTATION=+